MAADFARIVKTLRTSFKRAEPFFVPIPLYPSGMWSFTYASDAIDPLAPARSNCRQNAPTIPDPNAGRLRGGLGRKGAVRGVIMKPLLLRKLTRILSASTALVMMEPFHTYLHGGGMIAVGVGATLLIPGLVLTIHNARSRVLFEPPLPAN